MLRMTPSSFLYVMLMKVCFFVTFVRESLYPKGNNAPKDEGL
jgi:hypothetical protein